MKKLLYLGIVLMFVSCGSNELEISASTANVSGREVSTIKIGDLEVMTEDLGKIMKWEQSEDVVDYDYIEWEKARKTCENLGDGWRLPTKDELNLLYENKCKIGGFTNNNYWGSKEDADGVFYDSITGLPWGQYFGNRETTDEFDLSYRAFNARAVRSIE